MPSRLTEKKAYESPEVGTIFPLSSMYAEDIYTDLVKKIADVLAENGLIGEYMKPIVPPPVLHIRLREYLSKVPMRKHNGHWIDGGDQVVVFNPETFVPFFFNSSASKIIKMCNGKTRIEDLLHKLQEDTIFSKTDVLVRDLMQFLLLLEELDLIKFTE